MSVPGPIIGVDYGTARIGISVSDAAGIIASPHSTLPQDGFAVQAIADLASVVEATLVVVGLPMTLAGREGDSARAARELATEIADAAGLPVEFADERFTTTRAEEILRASTRDRRDRRSKVDAVAASVMLQGWLDARTARERGDPRYHRE